MKCMWQYEQCDKARAEGSTLCAHHQLLYWAMLGHQSEATHDRA